MRLRTFRVLWAGYRRTHTHIHLLQSLPQYLSLIHIHHHFPSPFPFHTYKIQFSFIQKKKKTIQKKIKTSNHEKYCNQRTMFRPTPFDSFRRHFLNCIMVEIFVMQKTKHLHLSTTKSIEFHYLTFFNINAFRLATIVAVVPIVFLLKNHQRTRSCTNRQKKNKKQNQGLSSSEARPQSKKPRYYSLKKFNQKERKASYKLRLKIK